MRRALGAALLAFALVPALGSAPAARAAFEPLPDLGARASAAPARATEGDRLQYLGGSVLHDTRTHLVFWEPSGSGLSFPAGYEPLVERFLADVAADSHSTGNVFGITGQYGDGLGPAAYDSRYGGAVTDTTPLPSSGCVEPVLSGPPGWLRCVTDIQIAAELQRVVSDRHLPTGPDDVYFVLTPNGLGDCQDATSTSCALGGSHGGYCAYHASSPDGLLYGVIPYNAVPGHCRSDNPRPNGSPGDPALTSLGHELAEVITDPLGDGWVDAQGDEIADVCLSSYGAGVGGAGADRWNEVIAGHHYWLQELWSRLTGGCAARPAADSVSLTGGWAGGSARFSARAVVPGGRAASYRWWFGDGSGGTGRSVRHAYRHGGRYRVVVRITDSAGNWAYARLRVLIRR